MPLDYPWDSCRVRPQPEVLDRPSRLTAYEGYGRIVVFAGSSSAFHSGAVTPSRWRTKKS